MSILSALFHVDQRPLAVSQPVDPDAPHAELGWTEAQFRQRYPQADAVVLPVIKQSMDLKLDDDERAKYVEYDKHNKKMIAYGHINRWGLNMTAGVTYTEENRILSMTWWPTEGVTVRAEDVAEIETEYKGRFGIPTKDVDDDSVIWNWKTEDSYIMLAATVGTFEATDLFLKEHFTGYDVE